MQLVFLPFPGKDEKVVAHKNFERHELIEC